MSTYARIDRSLTQRNSLVRLLQRLEQDDLSLEEMEEIGTTLQKAERQAFPLLMRRLRTTSDSLLIARYVYLLNFFEEVDWVNELARITLLRNDLPADGKRVLLESLERSGIDIATPPFAQVLDQVGGSPGSWLAGIFDKGRAGFGSFMEDFISFSQESQLAVVRQLAACEDPAAESLLEILLHFSDPEIVREVIVRLGGIRRTTAAGILSEYLAFGACEFRGIAERSLRRLSFLGIEPEPREIQRLLPALAGAVSPIEGSGFRTLCFSCPDGGGGFDVLLLQIHEIWGVTDAAGYQGMSREEYEELSQEVVYEDGLMEVSMEYALRILRDALSRNAGTSYPLPAEYFVWQVLLRAENTVPEPYNPDFSGFDIERITASSSLVAESASLLDDDCFSGWFSVNRKVFDFAEELHTLEMRRSAPVSEKERTTFLKHFMVEVIEPEKSRIIRRLLFTADLMRQTGKARGLIEQTLAVAASLDQDRVPPGRHPFLCRLALDSLAMAREALDEGYDPRNFSEGFDDGEPWN